MDVRLARFLLTALGNRQAPSGPAGAARASVFAKRARAASRRQPPEDQRRARHASKAPEPSGRTAGPPVLRSSQARSDSATGRWLISDQAHRPVPLLSNLLSNCLPDRAPPRPEPPEPTSIIGHCVGELAAWSSFFHFTLGGDREGLQRAIGAPQDHVEGPVRIIATGCGLRMRGRVRTGRAR